MKVKVIQADTRPVQIFVESRDLKYEPPNEINMNAIIAVNNGSLWHNADYKGLTILINMFKCKVLGYEYEMTTDSDENFPGYPDKPNCYIKIKALMNLFNTSSADCFIFIDQDAWIRDEGRFQVFLKEFKESSAVIAMPRDVHGPEDSFFNSGFIAVKNTPDAKEILTDIYFSPDYKEFYGRKRNEQGALSARYLKTPQQFMVLPLEDFNTPCGRIVRHAWIAHIRDQLVVEEVIASFTKIVMSFAGESGFKFGEKTQFYK
jgi:hypothetical protein